MIGAPLAAASAASAAPATESLNDALRRSMESSGIPGKIQLAPSTYELIRERFTCESRGPVQVKGKEPMTTYLLLERREGVAT